MGYVSYHINTVDLYKLEPHYSCVMKLLAHSKKAPVEITLLLCTFLNPVEMQVILEKKNPKLSCINISVILRAFY